MEQKKYDKVNLEKNRGVYVAIGLLTALTIVLSALEYRTIITYVAPDFGDLKPEYDKIEIIPHSIPEAPAAPKREVIQDLISSILIDEEANEEPIEFVPIDIDPKDLVFANNNNSFPIETVDEVDPIVMAPEVMPEFPGGIDGLLKYLSKEMKYPKMASRNNISGKVYLSFVVDKEGNIIDVKILRGVGSGCDEEAMRVVEAMPKWKPGKQGGRKVKVQYYLPINFTLK